MTEAVAPAPLARVRQEPRRDAVRATHLEEFEMTGARWRLVANANTSGERRDYKVIVRSRERPIGVALVPVGARCVRLRELRLPDSRVTNRAFPRPWARPTERALRG
jgi:hypothetical protein